VRACSFPVQVKSTATQGSQGSSEDCNGHSIEENEEEDENSQEEEDTSENNNTVSFYKACFSLNTSVLAGLPQRDGSG
jgi:hypothetical protein